jgi:hypothetical protein
MSEQKCPKCGYKIGVPLDAGGTDFKLTDAPCMCFCIRCLGVVWLSKGKPPREATNRELFILCTHRPGDILPMMVLALRCNSNLPLIDSASN